QWDLLDKKIRQAGREVERGCRSNRSSQMVGSHRRVVVLRERGNPPDLRYTIECQIRPDHIDHLLAQEFLKICGPLKRAAEPERRHGLRGDFSDRAQVAYAARLIEP